MLKNHGRQPTSVYTLYGKLSYSRTALVPVNARSKEILYQMTGKRSVYPLDEVLMVDQLPFKMTYSAAVAVAKEGVRARSYEDASENIIEKYKFSISPKEVENVTDFVGNIMFQKQCREAEIVSQIPILPISEQGVIDEIAYLMSDGAMIHFRDKNADYAAGYKGEDAWGESKHAICFSNKDIRFLGFDKNGKPRRKILRSTGIGYIGGSNEFEKHILLLAQRAGFHKYAHQVIVVDGCIWLGAMMKTLFPRAIVILDKYHALENAGKFANVIKKTDEERKLLADLLCDLIDKGDVEALLKVLEPYKNEKMPKGTVNMYTYVNNHKDFMDYPRYEQLGYYVGSGAMESANKWMMQTRLKLCGMRWKVERAQWVLTLKIYYECDEWDIVVDTIRRYIYKLDIVNHKISEMIA